MTGERQLAPPDERTTFRRRFLRRVTAAAAWGHGLDGYDLGVLSVALPFIALDLSPSAFELGLLGASSLIGIFVGGLVFGWVTDRIGRRLAFALVFLAFIVTSVAQLWTLTIGLLFLARLGNGFAIGAEYTVGAPMLAEFSPSSERGRRISFAQFCWYVGYLLAVVIGYTMLQWADLHWRWVLASAAVPAVIGLILRRNIPESPRWLARQGRQEEARHVAATYLGETYFDDEDLGAESGRGGAHWTMLFRGHQRQKTIFGAVMYLCLVIPYFTIFTFAPTVLTQLGVSNVVAGTIALNTVATIGTIAGLMSIESLGRRRLLIGPFAAAFVALALFGSESATVVTVSFLAFAFFNSAACVLIPVYPSELFPTSFRSTGTGVLTAISRIGAAIGTFLLPAAIAGVGISAVMVAGAIICALGLVTARMWAPETTGLTLSETALEPIDPNRTEPNA